MKTRVQVGSHNSPYPGRIRELLVLGRSAWDGSGGADGAVTVSRQDAGVPPRTRECAPLPLTRAHYCAQLTARELVAGRLPAGWAYRLPTEAEWEYASRADSTNRFSYGDDPSYTQLANNAWYDVNSGGTTHAVGGKQSNRWGLYDMSGNVWEWCSDWLGNYPGGSVTDPQGSGSGSARVFRGGGWGSGGRYCRSASRDSYIPSSRYDAVGFRVVLAPGQP